MARAKQRLETFRRLGVFPGTEEELLAEDVLFLADHAAEQAAQLARAHAEASKMRAVIEAARGLTKPLRHNYDCPRGGSLPGGCVCGLDDYRRALADFDRATSEGTA